MLRTAAPRLARCLANVRCLTTTTPLGQAALPEKEMKPLYLDAQATTPMDPRVLDAMLPYLTSYYGNPHSRTHQYGWESEKAMEVAREQVITSLSSVFYVVTGG